MRSRLIVDENTVYEIDEDCLRRRGEYSKNEDNYYNESDNRGCSNCYSQMNLQEMKNQCIDEYSCRKNADK